MPSKSSFEPSRRDGSNELLFNNFWCAVQKLEFIFRSRKIIFRARFQNFFHFRVTKIFKQNSKLLQTHRYIAYSNRLEKTVQDLLPNLKKVARFKSYRWITEAKYGNCYPIIYIIQIRVKKWPKLEPYFAAKS